MGAQFPVDSDPRIPEQMTPGLSRRNCGRSLVSAEKAVAEKASQRTSVGQWFVARALAVLAGCGGLQEFLHRPPESPVLICDAGIQQWKQDLQGKIHDQKEQTQGQDQVNDQEDFTPADRFK